MDKKESKQNANQKMDQPQNNNLNRRTVLKALAGVPVLGVFGYELMKNRSYANRKEGQVIKELGLEYLNIPKENSTHSVINGNKLRVGMIGFGSRAGALARGLGFMHLSDAKSRKAGGNLEDWLAQEDLNVDLVGICDVFDFHAERGMDIAKEGLRVNGKTGAEYDIKRYRSYQEMLADDSIDAVIVATPDHHHARITTDAVKAGKHVYCEKSIALTEEELNEVYNAVKNSDRVFQLGHQITENVIFGQAREMIKKDILGKISLIETTTNRNSASGAWIRHLDADGNPKPGSLETIDWEQWLGNRPKVPFSIDRYYNWTKWFDYDTGMLGQLFSHEYDAINQLLRIGIPKSAVASGGIYYWKDNREMPDLIQAVFEYPDKELTLMYSGCLASARQRGRVIMGHDASMELGGSISVTADYDSTKYKRQIQDGTFDTRGPILTVTPGSGAIDAVTSATEKYYSSRGLTSTVVNGRNVDVTYLHIKNWIDCIRSGETPTCDIEKAYEEGVTILMAHKSYVEKRRVEWDPVQRKIV
ncbi:gfo/Idh/MocA family oxidoreductase [Mariniphaga sediminis]|uniref:Gfo/Idh/MocA family oxidoreductase n=1 Tax=Mariniphaga sediminis TaxID=1628158 RepID=A0A399CZU1_9BACT|nr:Gfo/Idh/MocA family oxidoreductase [Mariniphaga sediminis]RIH63921.1 gfo/Idh/MocA family oxidoreductase [Mariniphaga sediminis]